ncbi:MAG: tRNA dihydrouridine synthase DusB [Porticoccaceae bacterium]|nr:tRNA dihydrouridine synthase DusB [Porticoccaceae bacterium]
MHFHIGPHKIAAPVILAPMAGITDLPMRHAARSWGAALTYSEMLTAETRLWNSKKSLTRLPQAEDPLPRPVQIAGYDAQMMADAAIACEQMGAGIIDINMGCPAKKVCKRAAGSALLQDEELVEQILKAVVDAVSVPVTLKTRTGWSAENKNGVRIGRIAQDSGIAALTVHGRTRACKFSGFAEYDTIAEIVSALDIPVIANGDIQSPEQAQEILQYTGASALMIGRAALGQPWVFQRIRSYLESGKESPTPSFQERYQTMRQHLEDIHKVYGEVQGVRIARKHMGWYFQHMDAKSTWGKAFNQLDTVEDQYQLLDSIGENSPIISKIAA